MRFSSITLMLFALPGCDSSPEPVKEGSGAAQVHDIEDNVENKTNLGTPTSALPESQKQAIAAIESLGVKVEVYDKSLIKPLVIVRSFPESGITDDGMQRLKSLTSLTHLGLSDTKISDNELVHLKELFNLQRLDLSRTKVTDAGLVHLKEMSNLQDLHLVSTKISDTGLEHLKGLTNLRHLFLKGTKVTSAGVNNFQTTLPRCSIFLFH